MYLDTYISKYIAGVKTNYCTETKIEHQQGDRRTVFFNTYEVNLMLEKLWISPIYITMVNMLWIK